MATKARNKKRLQEAEKAVVVLSMLLRRKMQKKLPWHKRAYRLVRSLIRGRA
jgi:hypothetical protein